MEGGPPQSPVTHRKGPATANRAQVQASVVEATAELLRQGTAYADLSVERIAKGAGISRTAFYFYFADKRDLIMKLAAEISAQLYEEATDFFVGTADSDDELRAILERVYDLYRRQGAVARAIVEVSTYDEEIAVFWRGLLDGFIDATEQRIARERAGESGAAGHAGDPRAVAFALVWMIERTLYQQLVQDEPIPRDALIDAVIAVFRGAR